DIPNACPPQPAAPRAAATLKPPYCGCMRRRMPLIGARAGGIFPVPLLQILLPVVSKLLREEGSVARLLQICCRYSIPPAKTGKPGAGRKKAPAAAGIGACMPIGQPNPADAAFFR